MIAWLFVEEPSNYFILFLYHFRLPKYFFTLPKYKRFRPCVKNNVIFIFCYIQFPNYLTIFLN